MLVSRFFWQLRDKKVVVTGVWELVCSRDLIRDGKSRDYGKGAAKGQLMADGFSGASHAVVVAVPLCEELALVR